MNSSPPSAPLAGVQPHDLSAPRRPLQRARRGIGALRHVLRAVHRRRRVGIARPQGCVRAEEEPRLAQFPQHDQGDSQVWQARARGARSVKVRQVRVHDPRRVPHDERLLQILRRQLRRPHVRGHLVVLRPGHDGVPGDDADQVLGQSPPAEHHRATAVEGGQGSVQGVRGRGVRRAPGRSHVDPGHRRGARAGRRQGDPRTRGTGGQTFVGDVRGRRLRLPLRPGPRHPRRRRVLRGEGRAGCHQIPAQRGVPSRRRVVDAPEPRRLGELELPQGLARVRL